MRRCRRCGKLNAKGVCIECVRWMMSSEREKRKLKRLSPAERGLLSDLLKERAQPETWEQVPQSE